LLFKAEYYLGTVIATTLAKLSLKLNTFSNISVLIKNSFGAEVLLILVSMLRLGKSPHTSQPIDPNSYERIYLCIKILSEPNEFIRSIYLTECRQAFSNMLAEQKLQKEATEKKTKTSDSAG